MTTVQPDWARWWRRFEEQQTYHIPRREQRFELMLDLVGDVTDGRPRLVLDLACGTGAISQRVLQRFPSTQVVALDLDPLLLAGFSFGAWVGLRVGCEEQRVSHLIGLGIPVNSSDFSFLSQCKKPRFAAWSKKELKR